MAALAELTVVVEAAPKSGSLITARYAEELNRCVGAMPGAPRARLTAGNNELLYDGARVVRDARDALEVLYDASTAARLVASAAEARIAGEPGLRAVLDAVEVGASLDAMAEQTGLGPRELRAALARLERGGLVRRVGLGSYVASAAP
jgi:DNA processing protein